MEFVRKRLILDNFEINMKAHRILIIFIFVAVAFGNCKKDDHQPELIARTGPDTTASIGDTVWLDASSSAGIG